MLIELEPKHGFEVWVNQALVETIENAFKKTLGTETLHYYYILGDEVKWMGTIPFINFIKKVQKVNAGFCPIGVTNAPHKKALDDYFEHHFHDADAPFWGYWIGDVCRRDLVCGDELVRILWSRILEQKTKDSKTRKNFYGE